MAKWIDGYCRDCNRWVRQKQQTHDCCPYCGQEFETTTEILPWFPKNVMNTIIETNERIGKSDGKN